MCIRTSQYMANVRVTTSRKSFKVVKWRYWQRNP